MENAMDKALTAPGLRFWPVGNGDSTTIRVTEDVFLQVDLCHLECAEDDDDDRCPVVDRLVSMLPTRNGKPYLSVFALTHPDEDHCCGFRELLRRVTIGELWHTPRIFREYRKDLCKEAVAFREEAHRRARATMQANGDPGAGNRVRLVGWDEYLQEDAYKGFPKSKLSIPGTAVTELDATDHAASFRAFIHAPFKDDADGSRNETSLAMQVTLRDSESKGRVLLLGDLSYPTIKRIFDSSRADDVAWDVLLASHHCSKSVMYWRGEGEEDETRRPDILKALENAAGSPGTVIASSVTVPTTNQPGDDPPHAKAKARYQEIAPGGFFCTADHEPDAISYAITEDGFELQGAAGDDHGAEAVRAAVVAARGSGAPPRDPVGFGRQA
jgi:beta-lactamase superfamily II metal-dependent hydrolase